MTININQEQPEEKVETTETTETETETTETTEVTEQPAEEDFSGAKAGGGVTNNYNLTINGKPADADEDE